MEEVTNDLRGVCVCVCVCVPAGVNEVKLKNERNKKVDRRKKQLHELQTCNANDAFKVVGHYSSPAVLIS